MSDSARNSLAKTTTLHLQKKIQRSYWLLYANSKRYYFFLASQRQPQGTQHLFQMAKGKYLCSENSLGINQNVKENDCRAKPRQLSTIKTSGRKGRSINSSLKKVLRFLAIQNKCIQWAAQVVKRMRAAELKLLSKGSCSIWDILCMVLYYNQIQQLESKLSIYINDDDINNNTNHNAVYSRSFYFTQ